MTKVNFLILFTLFAALLLFACDQTESTYEKSQSLEQSLEIRSFLDEINNITESPDSPTPNKLCIGCGCKKAFDRCEEGHYPSCFVDGPGSGIIEGCCKENRQACHKCDRGIVCVRLSFGLAVGEEPELFEATLEELIVDYGEEAIPASMRPVIIKHLSGDELTEEEYELIDDPIIIQ